MANIPFVFPFPLRVPWSKMNRLVACKITTSCLQRGFGNVTTKNILTKSMYCMINNLSVHVKL